MEKKNISVLVVEFNTGVRSIEVALLVRLLGFQKTNICEATNARQALAQLKKRKFDLLITGNRLDTVIREKSMTGAELIDKVKELNLPIKILMISGGGKPDLPEGVGFLQEPFMELEEFKKAVEKALA
jgi:CheY-like chemotaxis protein